MGPYRLKILNSENVPAWYFRTAATELYFEELSYVAFTNCIPWGTIAFEIDGAAWKASAC